MQLRISVIIMVLLCGSIAIAGCTGTQTSPTAPAQGTGTPVTPVGTGGPMATLTTVPTDVLPEYNAVQIDVSEKDYLGIITVTFQGGKGMNSIKKIDVKLTRADGSTQTATVGTMKGDEVELQGTRGTGSERGQTDRVEVWVTTNQVQTFRIVDVLREYRSRG
jgi:translation initiation factor 1 (eIF-1/SUI1)